MGKLIEALEGLWAPKKCANEKCKEPADWPLGPLCRLCALELAAWEPLLLPVKEAA